MVIWAEPWAENQRLNFRSLFLPVSTAGPVTSQSCPFPNLRKGRYWVYKIRTVVRITRPTLVARQTSDFRLILLCCHKPAGASHPAVCLDAAADCCDLVPSGPTGLSPFAKPVAYSYLVLSSLSHSGYFNTGPYLKFLKCPFSVIFSIIQKQNTQHTTENPKQKQKQKLY